MEFYKYVIGTVVQIEDFWTGTYERSGCFKMMTIEEDEGTIVNLVVAPSTYFLNHVTIRTGDRIIGFYDANAPIPLIYPPRYNALVIAKSSPHRTVTVDYFDENLVNSNFTLKLNVGPNTPVLLTNNQIFEGELGNRSLIVVYDFTTRSIPAQTTPIKIIVFC